MLQAQDDLVLIDQENMTDLDKQNMNLKKIANENYKLKNIDPESLINFHPKFFVYRIIKSKAGTKFSYQLSLDDDDLFYAKAGKHQNKPIEIFDNSKSKIQTNFQYILTPSVNLRHFSLTQDNQEISIIDILLLEQKKNSPFIISANWFAEIQENYHFKTRQPEFQSDGSYVLDFEGRFAEPSPINSIFEDCNTDETMIMLRQLDTWTMNSEALPEINPLFVFVLVLAVNLYPFC